MMEIAVDQAGEDLVTFVQAAQPSFEGMIRTIQQAESVGGTSSCPHTR